MKPTEINFLHENENLILNYFRAIIDSSGKISFVQHKKKLKENDLSAVFCQKILKDFNITLAILKFIVLDKKFRNLNLFCENCGSEIQNKKLSSNRRFCSKTCKSRSERVSKKISSKICQKNQKITNLRKSYDLENFDPKLHENSNKIKTYIRQITTNKKIINSSLHRKFIISGDTVAIYVDKILRFFNITLKDLKILADCDFDLTRLYCKNCGSKLKDLRREFCSIKCSSNCKETREKYTETCKEKYGTNWQNPNPQFEFEKNLIEDIKTFGIEKYKSRLQVYLLSLTTMEGDHNISFHRKNLRNSSPEAIFCETVLRYYGISLQELVYWIGRELLVRK